MSSNIDLVVQSRERDLGGFTVRRILPYMTHKMVGPFIFFDHMGPAEFEEHHGMDVRPHPHIGLATVTYLFDGKILHRDSLGSEQLIEPGAINWMTAGRGIVHSERTPGELREHRSRMNGIQCWVALPVEHEETEPNFSHHPKNTLPDFVVGDVRLRLLLGTAFGQTSPVRVHSDLFYLEAKFPKGSHLKVPGGKREAAAYVVSGSIKVDGQEINETTMVIAAKGADLEIEAVTESHVMLLGGESVGPRYIWWNLVASSKERLDEAKSDWAKGPRAESRRFHPIPHDDNEFIPLPEDPPPANPKGTPM